MCAGHRRLSEKGYLHRDISRGNIMITTSDPPNRGVLIDQDYTIPNYEAHKATEGDHRTVRDTRPIWNFGIVLICL